MWNPYGTAWRLQVYNHLRKLDANVIIGERGALPDTFYFDDSGLCVESKRYSEDNWSYPISDGDQKARVQQYIESIRFGSESLEGQAARVNIGYLRTVLKIPEDKKILFVPLQLSDDTVTSFFSVQDRTYADYLLELQKLANRLPRDWVLVYKNHPLAREKFAITGGVQANQFHINDLIEASDAIALFNSGTGLLAMAFGKPVFYYGRTFYAIDGINYPFSNAKDVAEILSESAPSVNMEKVYGFYSYLIERFYSFADVQAELAVGSEMSMRSKLKSLHYKCLRIPGFEEVQFNKAPVLDKNSILFDRYKFYWWHKAQQAAKPPVVAKPNPAKAVAMSNEVQKPTPQKLVAPVPDYSKFDEKIRKKIIFKMYSAVAPSFMSERHAQKLTRSPTQFFSDGKSLSTRIVRALVVPNMSK